MKVILMRDVAKVGRKNDVVEVPTGFGMNKLVPQGMAKAATPENLKAIKSQVHTSEAARTASAEAFVELIKALKDKEIKIAMDANEEGRLFQAVKSDVIATALSEATGQTVREEQIILGDPIKEVGEHSITLASGADSAKQTIHIEAK